MHVLVRLAAAGAPLLLISACGGSDPFAPDGGESAPAAGTVVVGSADFPESTLLGNIYAQALEAAGTDVQTRFNIGSREVYYDQIAAGNLSVFPEYNGAILFYLDPGATASGTEETNKAVSEALPEGLEILESSRAENKDSLTVTEDTAREYGLVTIGDLEPVAGELVLGGPPEFQTRPQGVPGLADRYGLEFQQFRSLDVGIVWQALRDGDIHVANLFSTDATIAVNDFVVLDDTENLFGSQNITPLVHADSVDEAARDTLDAVSAELTTEVMVELNRRVSVDHENPDEVAADWLRSVGLTP